MLLKAAMTGRCIFGTLRNSGDQQLEKLKEEIESEKCEKLQKCIFFLLLFFADLTFQWKSKQEKLVCESLGAAHRHERSLLHFIFTRTLQTASTIGLLARSHCLHLVNSAAPLLFPSLALSPPRPTLTVSPYCCCSQYNRAFLSDASACVLTFLNIST